MAISFWSWFGIFVWVLSYLPFRVILYLIFFVIILFVINSLSLFFFFPTIFFIRILYFVFCSISIFSWQFLRFFFFFYPFPSHYFPFGCLLCLLLSVSFLSPHFLVSFKHYSFFRINLYFSFILFSLFLYYSHFPSLLWSHSVVTLLFSLSSFWHFPYLINFFVYFFSDNDLVLCFAPSVSQSVSHLVYVHFILTFYAHSIIIYHYDLVL